MSSRDGGLPGTLKPDCFSFDYEAGGHFPLRNGREPGAPYR
jgi:hypothetical protein